MNPHEEAFQKQQTYGIAVRKSGTPYKGLEWYAQGPIMWQMAWAPGPYEAVLKVIDMIENGTDNPFQQMEDEIQNANRN